MKDMPYDPHAEEVRGSQAELESVVHRISEIRNDARNMLRNYFWSIYNPLNAAEAADFIASVMTHFSIDDSANSYQQVSNAFLINEILYLIAITKNRALIKSPP